MLLEVAYHLGGISCAYVVNQFVHLAQTNLIHTLACQRRCLAEERSEVFTHHFRVVLDCLCAKCLQIGFQHAVLSTLTTTIYNLATIVHLELHIASQTIKHVCGNVSLPGCTSHSH